MNVYFDTSALIKLLLREDGSELAAQLWDGAEIAVTCRIAYPEARAALASARRAGRIDAAVLESVVEDLRDLFGELTIIEVGESIALRAGDLAEVHSLRGYDAVHLAASLAVDDDDLVIATWDHDLCQAADAVGRLTAPPPPAR